MKTYLRRLCVTGLVAASILTGPVAQAQAQAGPAHAQQPTVATSTRAGCRDNGTNPSRAQIADLMEAVALEKGVPPQLLKVIGWKESTWRQFGSNGRTVYSHDGGIGLMQLTGDTARQFRPFCRLFTDTRFNIEAGAEVLKQKMAKAAAGVPEPLDKRLIESWYLPTRFYNGGGPAANAYAQHAFSLLRTPPAGLARHTAPLKATSPRAVWRGYAEPTRISVTTSGAWTFYSSTLNRRVVGRGNGAVHAWRPVYSLRNVSTGQCADIPGFGKGRSDGPVNQYPCNYTTSDNQRFSFTPVRTHQGSAGTYTVYQIRSTKDGLCLDVPGTGAAPAGAVVSQYGCRASDNQHWYRVPRSEGAWFVNLTSRLCLDVAGTRAGPDARLTLFHCSDGDDHRWTMSGSR